MVKKILNAFTLLELSIVLVIMVILTSISIDFGSRFFEQNYLNNTQLKIKKIQSALNAYLVENGKLPCPAGLKESTGVALTSCDITNSSHGVYVKDSVAKGWVPYETLDLTSDVVYDSWGNKITYMVANDATIDFYKIPDDFNGVKVYNATKSETSIANNAIYAIISHGKNGLGAYNKENTQNSLSNISNEEKINAPVDLYSHENNVLIYFEKPGKKKDDISIYSTRIQAAIDNNLENLSSYINGTIVNNLLSSYGLSSSDATFSLPSDNFLQYGDYIVSYNGRYKIKGYKYGKLELVDQAKVDDLNNLASKCNKASLLSSNAIFPSNSGYINVGESVSFGCTECSVKSKTNLFATCLVGGLWSYNGSCTLKTCNKSSLSYTNTTFTDKTGTLNCGENIVVNCNIGYTGTITATCNTSGNWSYTGSCVVKTCDINDLNDTTKINALTDTNIKNNTTNKNSIINSTFATSGTVIHNNTTTATGCESNYGGTKIKMKCYDGAWIWDTTNTTGEVAIVNTYNFTNGQQTWTVPSGVTRATFELWGAEGGGRRLSGNSSSGLGGLGGYVKATKDVSSGQTYYIYVGGKGNSSTSGIAYGGYNGGGNGYASSSSEPGNGGGGATDIRFGGSKTTYRILVAGGGGGGGEDTSDSYGHGGSTSCSLGSSSRLYDGYGTFLGDGGGGGGGYYGGYTSCSISTGSDTQGGCGGTNYTGGSGLYSISSSSGIREGNGLAKITYYKQDIIGCVYNVGSISSESSAIGSNLGYRSCLPSGSKVFNYTGSSQTWTVPDGVYNIKIQVWGAQGGSDYGGKGGYSYGMLSVSPGDNVYVYVGGQGSSGYNGTKAGGWNGGGSGWCENKSDSYVGGGGGSTDVRYGGTSTSDRKIVAGGGGGGGYNAYYGGKYGGFGGGGSSSGGTGAAYDSGCGGGGGTSSSVGTSGCSCGNSGSGMTGGSTSCKNDAGGGGGYYGGASGSGSGDAPAAGGGGSGYIGGVTNGGGSNGQKYGNGVARICWGENADCDITFDCQKSNISNPSNGIFDKSGTALYGEIVYGSCNSGYSGTITATCNSDGSWSYSGSCGKNCTEMNWNNLWNAFANTNPCGCACFQGLKTGDRWSYNSTTSIAHNSTWCGYVYTKANRGCSKKDKDFNGYACWTCNDGTLTRSSSSCSWHDSC